MQLYLPTPEQQASSPAPPAAGPAITRNSSPFASSATGHSSGSAISLAHTPTDKSGPKDNPYADPNALVPFATPQDAKSYQAVASKITAVPLPDPHEVARQFIKDKLGVDGDTIVLAHFRDDNARAQGRPDSTQTLTEAVMQGFMPLQNHDKFNAATGLIGGIFGGGASPTATGFFFDLLHSDSLGDALRKGGAFAWSRTGPGWLYNAISAPGNAVDRAKEEFRDTDSAYGLFKNNGEGYSSKNSYELTPSEVREKFSASTPTEELPYIKTWNKKLDDYWRDNKETFPIAARYNFVEQARAARDSGELTPEQYKLVMKGGAPGVPLKGPITFKQISEPAPPDPSVTVQRLDINGYQATNVVRFKATDGSEVMYIPGNEPSPFVPLRNKMNGIGWLGQQADPSKREAFLSHFSLYNRMDGAFHSGVETGLDKLVAGKWAPAYLNYNDHTGKNDIKEDVFVDMRDRTEDRLSDDSKRQTNNGWDGAKNAMNRAFPIMGPVGNAGAFGTSVDTALNGKNSEEIKQGAIGAIDAGFFSGVDIGAVAGHPTQHPLPKAALNTPASAPPHTALLSALRQSVAAHGSMGPVLGVFLPRQTP